MIAMKAMMIIMTIVMKMMMIYDDDYDENNDGKIIVQFSALVEKVEVDLLNKDDDNYKREVLHSVKVLLLLVISTRSLFVTMRHCCQSSYSSYFSG